MSNDLEGIRQPDLHVIWDGAAVGAAQIPGVHLKSKMLNRLGIVLDTLAGDRDTHMNVPEIQALLLVALSPGVSQKDLAKRIGIAQSETSRIITKFRQYQLVRSEDDPKERRRKIVWLTLKGQRLMEQVRAILGEEVG